MPIYNDKIVMPSGRIYEIPESVRKRGLRADTQAKVDQAIRLVNAIPGKYEKLRDARKASAKLGLTGLGNYKTGDDPNTPLVETDAIFREDKRIGERETAAIKEADYAANARGMMFSSFRDRNVGAALGRLSREAAQVITQYAGDMGKLNDDQALEEGGLYDQLETLYGSEVDYLKENPERPPSVEPSPTAPDDAAAGGGTTASKTFHPPTLGRIGGHYKTRAEALRAMEKLRIKHRYSPALYDLSVGKPGGKGHFVIMAKKR